MANNYVLFSTSIDNLTKKESVWLKKILELNLEDHLDLLNKELGANLSTDSFSWPDFEWSLSQIEKALWIYSECSGSSWNVALLMRAFLKKFRPKQVLEFSVAYTCSKPRIAQFSGESFVVTAKEICGDSCLAPLIRETVTTKKPQKNRFLTMEVIVRPIKPRKR